MRRMTDRQTSLSFPERIRVNGYTLEVRRSGVRSAQAIVLVHGIGVSSRYFLPFAKELAKRYDVSVLDLPGCGTAPDPEHTLSIAELGGVVAAYIQQEFAGSAVLAGHSMGCQIVAHAARDYPQLCDKLILLGPTVNKWERSRRMQAWRLLQDVMREPPYVSALVLGDYLRMGIGRYSRTLRSMISDKIEETLIGCSLPVLIVRGKWDPIVSAEWAAYLEDRLADARVEEIPRVAHVIQYKKPRELAAVVQKFL